MSDDAGTLPTQDAPAAAGAPAEGEKPKRGKPKDPHAPPKPKNAYQKCSAVAREKIKVERPDVVKDLMAMANALKEEWEKVPQEEKDRLTAEYEKEMEIWKPKWAAYKETEHYKVFFELKQDWIDARQMKKLKKVAAKEAPPRPKGGYMIFASEVRPRIADEVKAAGGGLSDVGKKIAEEWAEVSEAKKGDYGSQSAKAREAWLPLYAEYKMSDKYKKFVQDKAILENKQIQKKLVRTKLDGAPKKAPTAKNLWRKENSAQLAPELKGKSFAEMAKFIGEKWAQVPAEEKAKFVAQVEVMKKDFEEKKDAFKTNKTYLDFLLERRKAKDRENKTVGLINLPKRPQSVFAMFAEAHKTEVPPGKGEGKGRSALKAKFVEAAQDEKAELAKKEAEGKQKFQEELAVFKESEEFKKYKGNEKKIQTEFMNEAMKVMTLKFLRHSPPAPPKTGFAVFLGEKRKAEGEADGAPKSKKEKAEEVRTCKVEFMKLDRDTKKEYDTSRVEKHKEWQAQVKEYMEKPMWQDYLAEARRIKVPIKSLLAEKGKVIKKLKNGMRYIPLPEKPLDMPVKPKQAYSLFVASKKGSMELSDMPGAWTKLEEEERKKYTDEAASLQREYETNTKIFKESDEGKMYLKDHSSAVRQKRVVLAKFKFLGGLPKKPMDPKTKWMKQNVAVVKAEFAGLKGPDLSVKIMERFRALPEEERERIEKERQEQADAFRQSVKEFKDGENWQKYTKMVKAKAKSKPSTPVPEDMPRKPRSALQTFKSEQGGKGLQEVLKIFNELPSEEKDRRNQEARDMQEKFVADLAAWNKSDVGKKYNKQVAIAEKRFKLNGAKERYLKNEPKKALNAMQLWANEVGKALVQQEDPTVKGFAILPKTMEKWRGLSSEDRQEWLDKAAAGQEEYQKSIDEWKATPDFKKYTSIVSRLNGVKGGAGKGKGAKPKAKAVALPPKPEGMPQKPLTGYFIYLGEKRASGTGISKSELAKGWVDLGAEGQKTYNDKSKELSAKYDADMQEFYKTAEGKKYRRLRASADTKQKVENARKKFMGDNVPKKPTAPRGAYFLYANETRPTLGGLGFTEMAKKVSEMWQNLPPDEKKVFEDRNAEAKEKFEKELAEYRSHPSVKKFEKASGTVKKAKPKPKPKRKAAKPKARAAGRGKAKAKPKAAAAKGGSDSDVMGSDSSSSSNDSDSD